MPPRLQPHLRRTSTIAALFLTLPLLLAYPSSAGEQLGSAARPFPDTTDRTLVYADQFPSQLTDAEWKFIATHFVGGQKQTRSWVRRIRKLNPAFLMLHYQLAVGEGPALVVVGDEWKTDFEDVSRHEDWFVHDQAGHRLLQKDWNWFVMDIRSADGAFVTGFPQYWVDSALARLRANEDDGVFADSYTQDILIHQVQPPGFSWFSDVEACKSDWLPSLNAFGAFAACQLHAAPEKFYFLPNLGGQVTTWDKVTNLLVGDGGMIEGFASPGPGDSYSLDDWKLQMSRVLSLASAGKIVLEQTHVAAPKLDERWFVFGSYLLTRGPRSYINMMESSNLVWYPEYDLALGRYAEPPASDLAHYWDARNRVYRRRFEHGEVILNTSADTIRLTFDSDVQRIDITGGGSIGPTATPTGQQQRVAARELEIPPRSARVIISP